MKYALALLALSLMASDAYANGGSQRIIQRQVIVQRQQRVRQPLFQRQRSVQRVVVQQQLVQPLVVQQVQPIYTQPLVLQQQLYSQQYSLGVQQLIAPQVILRQGGCQGICH